MIASCVLHSFSTKLFSAVAFPYAVQTDEKLKWNNSNAVELLEDYGKVLGDSVDIARANNKAVANAVSARSSKRDSEAGLQGLTFCFVGRIPFYRHVWENRAEIDELATRKSTAET